MRVATALVLTGLCLLPLSAHAQGQATREAPADAQHQGVASPPARQSERQGGPPAPAAAQTSLPADSVTKHSMLLPDGRTLNFTATAGTIRLTSLDSGAPVADIAYIAFQLADADKRTRPVTFAMNGGPGYASAWLNLGAMGPWLLPMDANGARPSAPPVTSPNAQTWLPFTDLVFLDPAGTGYSRVRGGEDARKMLWSVNGDIDSLSTTIRRWVEQNGRGASPKFVAGESYGGFRAPRIVQKLQTEQGVGVNGMILVSPVLDFSRFNATNGLLDHVARLPSYAAAARANQRPITRADMLDVEAYARGEFLADLMRGLKDADAVERVSKRVSELTGIAPDVTRRSAGRIPMQTFLNEFRRPQNRVVSMYDANVEGLDPSPFGGRPEAEDQMRIGLHAPIVQAMVGLYRDELKWVVPDGRYFFQSEQAGRQWDWGNRGRNESVSALASAMALDPKLRTLVVHGLVDLVTPYYETQMVLDQVATIGDPARLRFEVYPGGHMFYSLDESRRMFRDHAREMIEAAVK
ncbi:MAG: peptidase S10 [Beijerinckiaceae bacterium]|nr:peptidase S10 [Beijerinckiaceae bacterium]